MGAMHDPSTRPRANSPQHTLHVSGPTACVCAATGCPNTTSCSAGQFVTSDGNNKNTCACQACSSDAGQFVISDGNDQNTCKRADCASSACRADEYLRPEKCGNTTSGCSSCDNVECGAGE